MYNIPKLCLPLMVTVAARANLCSLPPARRSRFASRLFSCRESSFPFLLESCFWILWRFFGIFYWLGYVTLLVGILFVLVVFL